jgi:hypothetical protein
MEHQELLAQILEELTLLRRAVERVADGLEKTQQRPATRSREAPLSEVECRSLYREILGEYRETRTTRKLDALLVRSKGDLSFFCSVNNLAVDLRNAKASIRDQILARVREDEQLSATYPMAAHDPVCLAERKKSPAG